MKSLRICVLATLGALCILVGGLAGPLNAETMLRQASSSPSLALPAQPLQFTSENHLLSFTPTQVYFVGLDHLMRLDFVGTGGVEPRVGARSVSTAPQSTPVLDTITYPDLWRGIDLSYIAETGSVAKSIYLVAPGADVARIRLRYSAPVVLESSGHLRVTLPNGRGYMTESAPVAWQEINGERFYIAVSFSVKNDTVGFNIARYDPQYRLIIDPSYVWHTFYGVESVPHGIATDSHGNVYITGESNSRWLGDRNAAPRHSYTGKTDIFVLKLDPNGRYLWHTFYGSNGMDAGWGIATDIGDNLYVTGYTESNWKGDGGANPLHSHSATVGKPGVNLFCIKLDSAGKYQWHTFYGPTATDLYGGTGIQVDVNGNIDTIGSSGQPWLGANNTNPLHPHSGGSSAGIPQPDIFVLQLDARGAYKWHTFYGASAANDGANGVAVDPAGNIYLTGKSTKTWQGDSNTSPIHEAIGYFRVFVLKLDAHGAYAWHTFYGMGGAGGSSLTLDNSNNIYVAGDSYRSWLGDGNTPPLHPLNNLQDMFILKLTDAGVYQWHTFYGSPNLDGASGIAITFDGVAVAGLSDGSWQGDPAHPPLHPYDDIYNSHNIAALKLDTQGRYQWNTFYGFDHSGFGIAADLQGNLFVVSNHGGWKGDNGQEPLHREGSFGMLKLSTPKEIKRPIVKLTKTGTDGSGHKFIEITARDQDSGIAKIEILKSTNANTVIPSFTPGTPAPLKILSTKIDQTKASVVSLRVTDMAGNVTVGDPVLELLTIGKGKRIRQTFESIPAQEHFINISNGTAGLQRLRIEVNGSMFAIVPLSDSASQTIDIRAAMNGERNTIKLVGLGQVGDSAFVVIGDRKLKAGKVLEGFTQEQRERSNQSFGWGSPDQAQ